MLAWKPTNGTLPREGGHLSQIGKSYTIYVTAGTIHFVEIIRTKYYLFFHVSVDVIKISAVHVIKISAEKKTT